ncbi:MAG TPA: DUF1501 domain-containing protein [Candidatus Limnocylindria bacterium]|nr:DUF1501 domain-containing protein [Candidatus Limnocylindria bacterium]
MTRRTLLQLGVATAATLATPWPLRRLAMAASRPPHFLVTMVCDGGWDVTQVFDVHDPLDASDGVDVDVPTDISGLPPSQIATAGGLTYMSNPTTRPTVDFFFSKWAARSAIVNGFTTRSTSHTQSMQLTLTGYLDPTRADFAVMAAHHNGAELPLPHLLLSGESFGGAFAGFSGRLGGQMRQAFAYNRLAGRRLAVSGVGEAYVQQALEYDRLLAEARSEAVTGRLAEYADADGRADRLAQLASSLTINGNNGTMLGASLAQAFRSGMTTSVTLSAGGGFDTHADNTQQNARFERVFSLLDGLVSQLAVEPGLAAPTLLDETTVVVCSEFARTPRLNGDNGKDHHPWNSMLLVGKNVRGGVTVGASDAKQKGVKVNLASGAPDDAGVVLDVTNVVAGVLTLVGANARDYLPSVAPFTAFIA